MKQKIIEHSPALDTFVDQMVIQKGFGNEDPEVLAQIKSDLLERLETHINAAIIGAMPNEHLVEFQKYVDKDDFEKMRSFCEKHIPALDSLVAATMENFAKSYLTE